MMEILAQFILCADYESYIINIILGNRFTEDGLPFVFEHGQAISVSFATGFGPLIVHGTVIDDVFGSGATFTIFGKPLMPNAPKVTDREPGIPNDLVPSPHSSGPNRKDCAITSLQAGQTKRLHVDLRRLALGSSNPGEDSNKTGNGYIVSRMRDEPKRKAAFDEALEEHTLDESQLNAVHRTFSSEIGLHLVLGPFGTGKTEYLMAALCAAVKAGFRVLVTGPTKDCVNLLASRFARVAPTAPSEWALYTGGGATVQSRPDQSHAGTGSSLSPLDLGRIFNETNLNDSDRLESPENIIAEQVLIGSGATSASNNTNKSFHYADRKIMWITDLAEAGPEGLDEDGKEAHEKATEYLGILEKLRSEQAAGRECNKDDRSKFYSLNKYFDAKYQQTRARVIFVENTTSCHPGLTANFSPSLHFMDEASLAHGPETMVP